MLAAGLAALHQSEQGTAAQKQTETGKSLTSFFTTERSGEDLSSRPERPVFSPSRDLSATGRAAEGSRHEVSTSAPTVNDQSLSAYAAFERAANEDLERSVGTAIDRALTQALPVAQALMQPAQAILQCYRCSYGCFSGLRISR